MEKGGRAKIVGSFTKTVDAQFAAPAGDNRFVPGWDAKAGAEQAMVRCKQRAVMGQKQTPRLGGKLISKREG